jgi:hypothetical protein
VVAGQVQILPRSEEIKVRQVKLILLHLLQAVAAVAAELLDQLESAHQVVQAAAVVGAIQLLIRVVLE